MRISEASRSASPGSSEPSVSMSRRELVEVGALPHAGGLDVVGDAPDRREDRVDRDDADRLVRRLVVVGVAVAAAAADREVQLELRAVLEVRDRGVGVEDLDAGGQVDVLGRDLAGTADDQRGLDLGRVGVHPADEALEVQDDVGDVLGDALDGRELVGDALDADARDGRPREEAQQHAAQRVAERVAEAALERLDRELTAVILHRVARDPGGLVVEHLGPVVVERGRRRGRDRRRCRRCGEAAGGPGRRPGVARRARWELTVVERRGARARPGGASSGARRCAPGG